MVTDLVRPAIPASCARRPLAGGLVVPYVNARLADGGVDFRTPHTARYEQCWSYGLCQTCGAPYRGGLDFVMVFGGPNQFADLHFDEPPLCLPCALYASQACPMLAGRQESYVDRPKLTEGHRGACPQGCGCAGWTPTDPSVPEHRGEPAHPWWAAYVRAGEWTLTGKTVPARNGRDRLVLTGAYLRKVPAGVMLVSRPGRGRAWSPLADSEIGALVTSDVWRKYARVR